MNTTTKLIFPLLCSAMIVAGCAQAAATKAADTPKSEAQTTEIELMHKDKKTELVLVTNGDAKTFNWSSEDLADPVALEKALSEVPEAQRENIRQLLTQMKSGDGMRFTSDGMTVHHLGPKADGVKVLSNKKVFIHKMDAGDGSEFSLLKSLLTDAKLNKEQLQELQKLLDSKY